MSRGNTPDRAELVEKIKSAVDRRFLLEVLRSLVRASSENPPGLELEAANVARRRLEEIGCWRIDTYEEIEGRPNILGWWGKSDGPTLVLNGHLDVVPAGDPASWSHPPYEAVVEGDRVYGRGTSDMKSGIASMIGAVAALGAADIDIPGRICFQLVSDEESAGTHGTGFLARRGLLQGDGAIVAEPTSLMVGIGERGALWAKIRAFGKSAHGSVPRQGISAVEKIAKAVLRLHGKEFGSGHPLFGKPALNVGTVRGGEKVNMVPDYAECEIDRRLVPGETKEEVLRQIEIELAAIKAEDPEANFDLEVIQFAEASEQPKDSPIVVAVARAVEDVIGGPAEYYVSPGSSDARFLRNDAGIPSVLFGPGIMALAHTVDEWADMGSVEAAAAVIAVAAHDFLTGLAER